MNLPHATRPLLVFAFALALPFAGSGCGKQACLFWTEAEGACPSRDEAIDFFADTSCERPIESVDSEGEFDGELCCYDVTETDTVGTLCDIPAGAGGFGSGAGGASPATTGAGGSSCQTCSAFANAAFMGTVPSGLCPSSQAIFDAMFLCLCSGACQAQCNASMCMGQSASTPCFDCATDSSVGCGSQFSACVNDI